MPRIIKNTGYEFRDDVQFCALAKLKHDDNKNYVSIYSFIFLYLPLFLTLTYGIFVTVTAYCRLRKGLPSTFTIRQKAIRHAWTYCIVFTIYISIVGALYVMTWAKNSDRNDYYSTADDPKWYRAFAISLASFGFTDFVVFFVINLEKYMSCQPCWCFCKRRISDSLKTRRRLLSSRDSISINYDPRTCSTRLNKQLLTTTEEDKEHELENTSFCKQLQQNCGVSVVRNHRERTINEALRKEVLAYTTDGIAQAIYNSRVGVMTENSYPTGHKDDRVNVINRFYVRIRNNWAVTLKHVRDPLNNNKRRAHQQPVRRPSDESVHIKINKCCCIRTTSNVSATVRLAFAASSQIDSKQIISTKPFIQQQDPPNGRGRGRGREIKELSVSSKFNKATKLSIVSNNSGLLQNPNNIINHDAAGHQREDSNYSLNTEENSLLMSNDRKYSKQREFVDYAPLIFRFIRNDILSLDDDEYKSSIIPSSAKQQIKVLEKCQCGEGKSGAFFYITHDNKFIVKTIKKSEVEYLIKILPDYKSYLEHNKNTKLSRCVGLHSLKIYGLTKYFMVMENALATQIKPIEKYDLKGSMEGRTVGDEMRDGVTMKDLDRIKNDRFVIVGDIEKKIILNQLKKDSEFLRNHNIMDYSLLLGIYKDDLDVFNNDNNINDVDEELKENVINIISGSGIMSDCFERNEIYYFGIIDALQEYTFLKWVETQFRKYIQRKNGDSISCVNPKKYQQRFYQDMKKIIISKNDKMSERSSMFSKQKSYTKGSNEFSMKTVSKK